MGISRA
jgi:Glycosyl hydrolase catalytic core